MASDAAVSRRLWGVSFKPSAAAAGSKLSRRKLRFLSGVEFADGKTSFRGSGKVQSPHAATRSRERE